MGGPARRQSCNYFSKVLLIRLPAGGQKDCLDMNRWGTGLIPLLQRREQASLYYNAEMSLSRLATAPLLTDADGPEMMAALRCCTDLAEDTTAIFVITP